MPRTSKTKISHPWAQVSLQSRERTRFLPPDAFYSQPWSMDSGSYQLAEKVIIIITITIVISPSGCVKAWGRFIVRLPPLRRQMRPSPVRSGSNRPSRSQASHFQSLPKAGLQIKSLHANQMPNIDLLLLSGFPTSQSQTERDWYLSISWST